ncbi:MAG TPA: hypothetical protein VEF76_02465 [Patescibacteria group bacterium]|nr:hypothetical protein [Patescibacteria group bacterium]
MKSSGIFDKGFWKKKLTRAGDAAAELLRPQPQLAPVRVKAKRETRRR